MKRFAFALTVSLLVISIFPGSLASEVPPDTTWEQRQVETLREVAKRFDRQTTYTSCVNVGFSAIGLMAEIMLNDLGDPAGRSVAEASDDIENIADNLFRMTGTPTAQCAWEQAGSPAVMHGALGIGFILHRWHDELPAGVRDSIVTALEGHWRESFSPHLVNGSLSVIAGRVLAGEALGYDSNLWTVGRADLIDIYDRVMRLGAIEVNAPLYSAYHYPPLMALQELEDDGTRNRGRMLLEYSLLVQSHLYLPGGALGAPQSRDRFNGGALDGDPESMHRVLWYLTGEDRFEAAENVHLAGAVSSYRLPEAIRSIFLDKGDGYSFWTWADSPLGTSRFPDTVYQFGPNGEGVAPWQVVTTPGGNAMWGINHGFRFQAIHVSSGVYARGNDGRFAILYHYQPYVDGDTTETGGRLPSTNGDSEPGDFVRELYDYERFGVGRTFVSLWDPTLEGKGSDVRRTQQYTLAHVPDYEAYGGEMRVEDGWLVGHVSDVYVAYRPLGNVTQGPEQRTTIPAAGGGGTRNSPHYFLRLDGRSGCMVELATTEQFATIDDYVDHLKTRTVEFSSEGPMHAEVEALDPQSGQLRTMRLEYAPERRFLDGVEMSADEALNHGLFDSPWVEMGPDADSFRVERDCYDRINYDIEAADVQIEPAPADCASNGETVFSPVSYYGDAQNWEPQTPSRWAVVEEDDDLRLFLRSFPFVAEGDRLGEYTLVRDRTYMDFDLTLSAKTNLRVEPDANADYAVVFGWQDRDNYYFLLANSTEDYSELFVLEDGERRSLGVADTTLVPDEEWHELRLVREDDTIRVSLDGTEQLVVEDATYGEGRVGVGTFNDTVFFDDIRFAGEDGGGSGDAADADGAGDPRPDAGAPADETGMGGSGGDSGLTTGDGCGCGTAPGSQIPLLVLLMIAGLLAVQRKMKSQTLS